MIVDQRKSRYLAKFTIARDHKCLYPLWNLNFLIFQRSQKSNKVKNTPMDWKLNKNKRNFSFDTLLSYAYLNSYS